MIFRKPTRKQFLISLLVLGLLLAFVTAVILRSRLTATEKALVGRWVYEDDPGMVVDYRSDRTMIWDYPANQGSPGFARWWIEDGMLNVEYSVKNDLHHGMLKMIGSKSLIDRYRIRQEANGSFLIDDDESLRRLIKAEPSDQ